MSVRELRKKLESIKGNNPIANARRLAIMALIARMTSEQD